MIREKGDPLSALYQVAQSHNREEQLLLRVLSEELGVLQKRNEDRLATQDDVVADYETIRRDLSASERDAFLRAVLDEVKGIADTGRQELRGIIRGHIERMRAVQARLPK